MITETECNSLKKIFGKHYTKAIMVEVETPNKDGKITYQNKFGARYTHFDVMRVFNGKRHDPVLEKIIFKAANSAIEQAKKIQDFKSKVLEYAAEMV